MLIIAIPKSASTALLKTLGGLHGVRATQQFFPDRPQPPGYPFLWKLHSDIRELESQRAESFSICDHIYKQHIPPTPNNRRLLAAVRKVILLRRPDDIVRAYWRGQKSGVHSRLHGFEGVKTEQDWIDRAESLGLTRELTQFYEGWLGDGSEKLVITYEDLMSDCTGVIRRIEEYWQLDVTTGEVQLLRERYSRVGPLRAFFVNRIYLRGKRTAERLLARLLEKGPS